MCDSVSCYESCREIVEQIVSQVRHGFARRIPIPGVVGSELLGLLGGGAAGEGFEVVGGLFGAAFGR
jgi:hypothetical protein